MHPTTAAHQLIADDAISVLNNPLSVPEPSNQLGVLALGILGTVSLYKRK